MPKPLMKSRLKVFAAIFLGILILDCLVLCPMLFYRWRDSARSEEQYKSAPLCAGNEQGGCRREVEAVVKGKYDTSSRYKTTHYISLLMPGSDLSGNIPVWWETDHSLYGRLKPGDTVMTEEWEGQIVAIHGANNTTLLTEYYPTYKREGLIVSLIAVPLVGLLIIFLEYKLIRGFRK